MNKPARGHSDAFFIAVLVTGLTLLAGLIGFAIGANMPVTTLCKPQFMISVDMMEATQ